MTHFIALIDVVSALGLNGFSGALALAVGFLFKTLAKQLKEATLECKRDRDDIRVELKESTKAISSLEVRTAKAELIAKMPCSREDCAKRIGLKDGGD